jgi:Fe2+ or Zn2+ uptake regulation protein
MSYVDTAVQRLKARGNRITRPRVLALEALDRSTVPVTPYELADRIKALGGTGDVVGVYRTLEMLLQNGLVHRIVSSGRFYQCQLGPEDDCQRHQRDHCHHTLICRTCGRIEEVHCPGVDLISQVRCCPSRPRPRVSRSRPRASP